MGLDTRRLVTISGPTGGGKSTLVRALSTLAPELTFVHEPDVHAVHTSGHMQSWYDTQLAVVRDREAQLLASGPMIVMDRHFSEDRLVFFRLHRELGNLDSSEYESLVVEALEIEARVPAPEATVFVTASPQILRNRMRCDGQPAWLITELDLQLNLYAQWLEGRTESVVQVDTSDTSAEAIAPAVLQWIGPIKST